MWIFYAFGSAFFAGVTAILAKIGIRNVDSHVATALRTIVITIFAWLMVLIVGSYPSIRTISSTSLLFLILSGLATGASWICYFKALQLGNVNQVVPIDKSSTILSMILAFVILQEPLGTFRFLGMAGIAIGTYLMIQKKSTEEAAKSNQWLFYAIGSAVFAALTSILGKIGVAGVESNLAIAIRTVVVLIMAWTMVVVTKQTKALKQIDAKSMRYILISGLATGLSWLCYYKALKEGPASIVVPIDKLSIVISIAFSYFVLKERITKQAFAGLALIVCGTLLLLV